MSYSGPDPAALGDLLLDDCIFIALPQPGCPGDDGLTGSAPHSQNDESCFLAYVFEEALLFCRPWCSEGDNPSIATSCPLSDVVCHYPIERWDLGPALRYEGPLSDVCAISTCDILRIYRPETGECPVM